MLRFLVLFFLGLGTSLGAQDLGRTDALWRGYLAETVSRGLPLLNTDPLPGVVPFWPRLERLRDDAASLEPGPDADLVGAWMDLQAGARRPALTVLEGAWPRPALRRFAVRSWGEALFTAWDPSEDSEAWTRAWLAWENKAYSPRALARGLEVLEKTDPSAVAPLLEQAHRLYPEDRRFLSLVARHPDAVPSAAGLIARDRVATGGWSSAALRNILRRAPGARELLIEAGYEPPRLEAALVRDYGSWLRSASPAAPADGEWTWDADGDGVAESHLVFQGGHLVSWTRETSGGLWTLGFAADRPSTVTETRSGAVWTLRYEDYPWAQTLEYRWADTTLVYRFLPLAQSVPLWPTERFRDRPERLPSVLASLWLPLDPRALALQAASVETWVSGVRAETVSLYRGQVWLAVEDSNRDGRDDTWSYYRGGRLVSVYRDLDGRGQATLRELYDKGQLTQVQVRGETGPRAEFVLFPSEGVQLWDPRHTGRPLDRIFVWTGEDRLNALVFSGTSLPWETMPDWEARP